MDLDTQIVHRETERQRIQIENRTERIVAVATACTVAILILSIAYLIALSIDTPDPKQIAGGTKIDCIVRE